MPQVYADADVTIEAVTGLGSYGNNTYLIRPAGGGAVTMVDVPEGVEAAFAALDGAAVERIVVTHHHFDHWAGYDVARAATDAPVLVGAEETNIDPARPVQRLAHDARFTVGAASVRVIHTPGHTPGSICLLVGGALLTGDTLFPGGPGRTRDPQALAQLIDSITSRLHVLPPETLVLPGHGDTTTIGASREDYAVFASKPHRADLSGDVLWKES